MKKQPRREFIKTFALAGAAATLPGGLRADEESRPPLHLLLQSDDFKGATMQDGSPFSATGLKDKIKNDYVIVSFGWNGCDTLCPQIDSVLAYLGTIQNKNLTSLVVDVLPRDDNASQQTRNAFLKTLQDRGIKQKIITLYPESTQKAKNIQINDFQVIANPSNELAHSAEILLYGPGGRYIAKKSALQAPESFKEWKNLLDSPAQSQQK